MVEADGSCRPGSDGRAIRLVVIQGPVQALVACAAVRHAERRWGAGHRNVMLFGGVLADDDIGHYAVVRQASLDCAGALEWDRVLELAGVAEPDLLRAALAPYGEVAEVICSRNWQPVNELALVSFPDARRVVVGDGLGVIDVDHDPRRPQFHLALPVIPVPLRADSLDGMDMEVVPRQTLLEVMSVMRAGAPHLRAVDEELACFAEGGVLLLMNYLAEAYDSTLRGEIELAHRVVRAASPPSGSPIVIKPHPRSSLGQAAAVARRLRTEGRQVRIMGQHECGHYSIELFERLIHAVDHVLAQGSSSALSIMYLHRVRAAVELPRGAARHLLPRQRKALVQSPAHLGRYVDQLAHWDGRSALPPRPAWTPSLGDRILGRLARPIMWAPTPAWRRRMRRWELPPVPSAILAQLGDAHPYVVPDHGAGTAWLLSRAMRHVIDTEQLSGLAEAPAERTLETLSLLSRAPGARVALVAAVVPSSHAPGWLRWWRKLAGIGLIDGARLSAEQFEDLLETRTDVLLRVPEVGLGFAQAVQRRALRRPSQTLPSGFVAFACRIRHAPARGN